MDVHKGQNKHLVLVTLKRCICKIPKWKIGKSDYLQ